jgi:hypothetical protein
MNYGQIKSLVKSYLQTQEPSFDEALPLFIQLAEDRILKEAQLTVFQANATSNAIPDNRFMPTPTDFLAPMSYSIVVGTAKRFIQLKETSFVQAIEADGTVTGAPLYYALFDENTFIFGPTPDDDYPLELQYLYRPASLTLGADSDSTWLSRNAPTALLYATLVEGYVFQKGEQDLMQLYMGRYQEALRGVKLLGEAKQTTEWFRNDQLRRPRE